MKKTLLIFFIILSALGQLLAFSGSTSTDSVVVSSNKTTDAAISHSEEAALTIAAHNLLTNKAENNPLDSGNIASTVNPRTPKALKTNNHFPIPNQPKPLFMMQFSPSILILGQNLKYSKYYDIRTTKIIRIRN
jgi:amino acid transporter